MQWPLSVVFLFVFFIVFLCGTDVTSLYGVCVRVRVCVCVVGILYVQQQSKKAVSK